MRSGVYILLQFHYNNRITMREVMELIEVLIGKRIKEQRKKNKLTQEQLSEKLGISKNHLSAIERGVYRVQIETLVMIINCLGCTADDLFCDVIDKGYMIKSSRLSEKIEKLSPEEQNRILAVVDTLVENAGR